MPCLVRTPTASLAHFGSSAFASKCLGDGAWKEAAMTGGQTSEEVPERYFVGRPNRQFPG
jgi:hypothetical protein